MPAEPSRATAAILAVAGLTGAAGVVAAAAVAHVVATDSLRSAAEIMMVHACAAVAVTAVAAHRARPKAWLAVAALILLGALLFGGDIALRTAYGRGLFPMAAPTGGTILILAWLALAAVALWDRSEA